MKTEKHIIKCVVGEFPLWHSSLGSQVDSEAVGFNPRPGSVG